MSKFRVVSLVASSLLASLALADTQTMFLEEGWSLKGSKLNSANVNGENISYTLKYSVNGWERDNGDGTLSLNAGEGFWIKSKKETAIFLKGDTSTEDVKFEKAGWHLATPVTGSLSLASLNSDKYSSIWSYRNGQWLDKDKMVEATITKLEVGDGFWIKTSSDGLTIKNLLEDATANAVATGSVDLSSIINPVTGEVMSGRGLRDTTNPVTGEVIPDEATVQVYDADDTDFSDPLLKEAVTINPLTGEYVIETKDLRDTLVTDSTTGETVTNPLTGKIIRVIAKKDDKNYDLSALATDSNRIDVNPITSSIRTQIIDTIKTMFGDSFAKEMKDNASIMAAINSLVTAIGSKVEQDIKDGKISLRQADFETDKKPTEITNPLTGEALTAKQEKDEKVKTQLNTSSASTDVAKFESEVSYQKKATLNLEDIDISKSATNVDIAIMEYDIISTFAKMNLAVHDGNGRLVLFLPVAPEEFDKLPGDKFKITVKKDDGSEFVVGDDPALRAIDLEKSLKNATGSEKWASELIDTLLNSPIVPYNAIKTLVKKDLYESELGKLGTYLQDQITPDGGKLFDTNPLAKLIEYQVRLSSDAETSVKRIISKYTKPLLASNLLWMENDLLFEAVDTNRAGKFLELFEIQNGESEDDFIARIEKSTDFRQFLKDIGVPLIHGIPPIAPSENTIQFKDNYIIDSKSTILPRTGIALTNMLMATSGLSNITITKKKVSDIVGDYLPDNAKELANKEIWWAEEGAVNNRKLREVTQDEISWMKDFIIGLTSELSGEKITAETRFAKVISDVKIHVKAFQTKVEEKENNFFKENFVNVDKVDSVVSFQVVDFDEAPITDIKEVTFIPHIEHRESLEIRPLTEKAKVLTPLDTQARFKKTVTIYSPEVFVNEKGEEATNGEWRYLTDYNVKITLSSGETFELDHPISLFPIEQNNLNYIYIDKNFDVQMVDGVESADEFHYQVLGNGDKLSYPLLNRELATYNNLNFTAMDGVRFGILAENWQQQEELDIWNAPVIPKPAEDELVTQFAITFGEGISEGALIMVDIEQNAKLRQAYGNAKLLMTVDFADKETNEVGIAIEPMPQDNFDSNYIKDGKPICYTSEGKEIELPLKEDGTYPFPDDPQYPAECLGDIFGEIPTCWSETNQKEISLVARADGTYPWPGDPDYPKECLTNVTDIIPTDCQGRPFPYDEAMGKYIYPENEMFPMDKYDLSCMAQDYFDDFESGQIGGNVASMYEGKCDTNGDGEVDETEKAQCADSAMNTVSTTYQAQCDTNKDGEVDDIEKEQCNNNIGGMIGELKECYDQMGNMIPCDEPKECKDEAGNMIPCDESKECYDQAGNVVPCDNNMNIGTNNTADMCGTGDAPYLVDATKMEYEFNFYTGDYVEVNLNDYFTFSECTIKNFGMHDWDSQAMSDMMARALREMGDSIDGLALDNATGIYSGTISDTDGDKVFKVRVNASNENGTSPDVTFVFYIYQSSSEMM